MLILSFETSAKAASVALLEDGRLLGETYLNCGQTHSVTLMQMAQDLLRNCGRRVDDVTAVAAAAGPGSFTGIRIGVAAAKGFAWGRDLPCVGVSTLEGMAYQGHIFEGIICCAMDARRSQVYTALFRAHGGTITRLTDDAALSLEELDLQLAAYQEPKLMVGDGAVLCYNTIGKNHMNCSPAPEHMVMQRASGIALAAKKLLDAGGEYRGTELTPNYLRLSQAERERAEKMAKQ